MVRHAQQDRAGIRHDRRRQGGGIHNSRFRPLGIEAASVTGNRVSLLIGADYHVSLTKRSERAAFGLARGPLGNGTASLIRQ